MKRKSHGNRILSWAGAFCTLVLSTTTVFATTTDKINEQKEKIDALEEQQEAAEQAAQNIAQQVTGLNEMLSGLNTNLSNLSSQIEILTAQTNEKETEINGKQSEIAQKKAEIESTTNSLRETESQAAKQYEDMKKRIQFMYENGTQSMLTALFSSESVSAFLSKAEYIESITQYDRRQLSEYQETCRVMSETKAVLEQEQAVLEQQEAELTASKQQLDALENATREQKGLVSAAISDTQANIAKSAEDLADAQAMADELAQQIEKEKAYELELEKQKAAEDAARISSIKAQEAENTSAPVVIDSSSDQELLAALIYCEAGGEIYDGQVAVGCVVMNRVRSGSFPNSVSGVIYQSGQFSPVASGRLATVLGNGLTTDSCRQAAATVLAGNLPYPDFLYFRSARVSLPGVAVTWIGNQQFY